MHLCHFVPLSGVREDKDLAEFLYASPTLAPACCWLKPPEVHDAPQLQAAKLWIDAHGAHFQRRNLPAAH